MLAEIGFLAAGAPSGYLLRRSGAVALVVARGTTATIYFLLFSLGAAFGADSTLISQLSLLGGRAVLISLFSMFGRVLCLCAAGRFVPFAASAGAGGGGGPSKLKAMAGSLRILFCFCLGVAIGLADVLPAWAVKGDLSTHILWAMLFMVGMGLGIEIQALSILREIGLKLLLVPALTMAGTFIGSILAAGLLAEPDLRGCLGVGAGFGYYSLSSILITRMSDPALGSTALMANMFRELFTLLAAPLLVRFFGGLAPVAAAGAPAMDTCLPVITQSAGERCGIVAIFNGIVLTVAVPFLVTFILSF